MMMIISCHFCQYYGDGWSQWLNVGVQIFFILSGFLYGHKHIDEPVSWILKQFTKILIPYYALLFIVVILYGLFCPSDLNLMSTIRAIFCVGTIKGTGHLWFVGNILFCYLITPYLSSLFTYYSSRGWIFHIGLLATLMGLFTTIGVLTGSYFRPGNILCYVLGYFFCNIHN